MQCLPYIGCFCKHTCVFDYHSCVFQSTLTCVDIQPHVFAIEKISQTYLFMDKRESERICEKCESVKL